MSAHENWWWKKLVADLDKVGLVIVKKHDPVPGRGLSAAQKERYLRGKERDRNETV